MRKRSLFLLLVVVLALVAWVAWPDGTGGRDSVDRSAATERDREGAERASPRSEGGDSSPASDANAPGEVILVGTPPDEVPACYVGSVRLAGFVVDRRDQPIEGAYVHLAIPGYHPYSSAQREHLQTRTGADGSFEFLSIPESARYQLAACAPFRFGYRIVDGVPQGPVEVRLSPPMSYRRLSFLDENGNPIAVDRAQAILRDPLRSRRSLTWLFPDWTELKGFRPADAPLSPNEYFGPAQHLPPVNEFRPAPNLSDMQAHHPVAIWFPGHRRVELGGYSHAPEDWPRSTPVVLQRGSALPGRRDYEIDFGSLARPPEWRHFERVDWIPGPQVLVVADPIDEAGRLTPLRPVLARVTERRPRFSLPEGQGFRLQWVAGESDEFVIPHRRDGSRVVPDWPPCAYLTIRWTPGPGGLRAGSDWWFGAVPEVVSEGGVEAPVLSVRVHPGLDLLGPLPAGTYWLQQRNLGPGGVGVTKSLGHLSAGHHVVEWAAR